MENLSLKNSASSPDPALWLSDSAPKGSHVNSTRLFPTMMEQDEQSDFTMKTDEFGRPSFAEPGARVASFSVKRRSSSYRTSDEDDLQKNASSSAHTSKNSDAAASNRANSEPPENNANGANYQEPPIAYAYMKFPEVKSQRDQPVSVLEQYSNNTSPQNSRRQSVSRFPDTARSRRGSVDSTSTPFVDGGRRRSLSITKPMERRKSVSQTASEMPVSLSFADESLNTYDAIKTELVHHLADASGAPSVMYVLSPSRRSSISIAASEPLFKQPDFLIHSESDENLESQMLKDAVNRLFRDSTAGGAVLPSFQSAAENHMDAKNSLSDESQRESMSRISNANNSGRSSDQQSQRRQSFVYDGKHRTSGQESDADAPFNRSRRSSVSLTIDSNQRPFLRRGSVSSNTSSAAPPEGHALHRRYSSSNTGIVHTGPADNLGISCGRRSSVSRSMSNNSEVIPNVPGKEPESHAYSFGADKSSTNVSVERFENPVVSRRNSSTFASVSSTAVAEKRTVPFPSLQSPTSSVKKAASSSNAPILLRDQVVPSYEAGSTALKNCEQIPAIEVLPVLNGNTALEPVQGVDAENSAALVKEQYAKQSSQLTSQEAPRRDSLAETSSSDDGSDSNISGLASMLSESPFFESEISRSHSFRARELISSEAIDGSVNLFLGLNDDLADDRADSRTGVSKDPDANCDLIVSKLRVVAEEEEYELYTESNIENGASNVSLGTTGRAKTQSELSKRKSDTSKALEPTSSLSSVRVSVSTQKLNAASVNSLRKTMSSSTVKDSAHTFNRATLNILASFDIFVPDSVTLSATQEMEKLKSRIVLTPGISYQYSQHNGTVEQVSSSESSTLHVASIEHLKKADKDWISNLKTELAAGIRIPVTAVKDMCARKLLTGPKTIEAIRKTIEKGANSCSKTTLQQANSCTSRSGLSSEHNLTTDKYSSKYFQLSLPKL